MMRSFLLALPVMLASLPALAAPPITAVCFSPDGRHVVAASEEALTVYDWPALKLQFDVRVRMPHVTHLAFSPDEKQLLVTGGSPADSGGLQILAWPVAREEIKRVTEIGDDVLFQSAWIDEDQIAVASVDGHLAVVNRSGERICSFQGHSKHVLCVEVSDDRKWLFSGSDDTSLRVWNLESGELHRTLNQHTAAVRDLAVKPSSDGPLVVAYAGADRTVRLWQPTIGRLMRFARLESPPLAIAWTPRGDRILAACEDGHLRIIDSASVKVVQDTPAITGWAYGVAVSPDGLHAVVAGENGQLRSVSLGGDSTPRR